MWEIQTLCDIVRQTSYEIHLYHGFGHFEKVYENALFHRLKKTGIRIDQQFPVKVYDEDQTLIGEYQVDLLVEEKLIVELKAVKTLSLEHEAQVLGYMKSTRIKHALLINFGSYRFSLRKFIGQTQYEQNQSNTFLATKKTENTEKTILPLASPKIEENRHSIKRSSS